MTDDDLAVDARGLVKRFGDVRAVDGIDLRVRRGQVFGDSIFRTAFVVAKPTSSML